MLGVVDMVFDHVTVQLNKETLSQIEDKQKQREDNEKRIQEEHQAREQKKILAELADQANKSSAESSSTSTHTSTSTSSSSDTASSTSSTESPKASSSSSTGIPKIPWIADVNVDDLGTLCYIYRLALTRLQARLLFLDTQSWCGTDLQSCWLGEGFHLTNYAN